MKIENYKMLEKPTGSRRQTLFAGLFLLIVLAVIAVF